MEFDQVSIYANLALAWIGFGTIVGLAAKSLMPGRDPGGSIAMVLMGIIGTLFGCVTSQFFTAEDHVIQPISPTGWLIGLGGSLALLVLYKVFGGYWFTEATVSERRARRRRRYYTVLDD